MNHIYLDNAATTKIKKEVLKEMTCYLNDEYANPSAHYSFSLKSQKAIENARYEISNLIGSKPEEIYFTSGGTESDNWAIKTIAENYKRKGNHIITSSIEHHAVLNTVKWLEENGFEVTYIKPKQNGIVDVSEIEKSIRNETILISVMTANNEIGTVQPIKEIGTIAKKNKIIFHTDAVQAVGHIPIDVKKMKIDLLSASGHKFYGPKGVGFLYVKDGVKISPFIHGGGQEFGLRAGTYNVPGIVGLGKAAQIARMHEEKNIQIKKFRDHLINRIIEEIPNTFLNGDKDIRLPNNVNIRFEDTDSESILALLGSKGIYASAGSACTSGNPKPSHVLISLGLTSKQAESSIRMTLSDTTTLEDIDYTVDEIKKIISMLNK